MTKEEATQKIRKLMATNGRTDAEADTANILAAILAEKHGIDIAAIDTADEQRASIITHRAVGEWVKCPAEGDYASLICQRFFEISAFTRSGWCQDEMIFVGTEWHLQVAEYVFNYLIKEFRWQWNKKRGRCKKRKHFVYGCYTALYIKLKERFYKPDNQSQIEISYVAKRAAYIKENFGEMKTTRVSPKDKAGASARNGFKAGQDIDIRPGLKDDADRKQPAQLPGFESRLLSNG